MSAVLDPSGSYTDIFRTAVEVPTLKTFIHNYPNLIQLLPLLLGQAGNSSTHAAGTVITPKYDPDTGEERNLYDWMPVKKDKEGLIISEWEGEYVDKVGFLKCDILGLSQLDKFARINELIRMNGGQDIHYDDINLDEEGVYDLFKNGVNEDVFQMTGSGLRGYCKELKPETIHDIIATVAIYRPGPIEIGVHKNYVAIKNGEQQPEYDFGSEEITKTTHGLWVYQEQIMQACQAVAGFSLVEADGVRKAMGKMLPELLQSYGEQFVQGAIKNGCPETEAQKIWDKFKVFGAYAFNLSHSACYGITAYFSQWFKYKFPLEFWTTSLEFSDSDQIADKISEIDKLETVRVAPVDINKSRVAFYPDKSNNTIYWSLSSIKWVGGISVEAILGEREKNGAFFTLEEFYSRVEKRVVNKRSVVNLILAGAFDEIENIKEVTERWRLIEGFMLLREEKMTEDLLEIKSYKDYEYIIKQKELTGFGYINFEKLVSTSSLGTIQKRYLSGLDLELDSSVDTNALVVGVLKNAIERNSKRGVFVQLELDHNSSTIFCTVWNDTYEEYKKIILLSINKVVMVTGKVVIDNYKKKNVIHSNENSRIVIV